MKYFNFIAALLFALLYLTGKIPPTGKYNLWITSFIIPVALAINHVLLFAAVIMRKKSALFYLASLLIGVPYLFGTVGIKHFFNAQEPVGKTFSVMSYNTGGYRVMQYDLNSYEEYDSMRLEMKDWLLHADADIRCYQEFTNFPLEDQLDVVKQLKAAGTHFYFSREDKIIDSKTRTGTLIISKFPIIATGDVLASKNGFNRVAYADVKIDSDTVRIVNVHLESMGLYYNRHHGNGFEGMKVRTVTMLHKLKVGVVERSHQMKQLAAFIETSPYPVVCAGDFNDMPYSYSYQYLKKQMKNSFEESGSGVGFTYNGGKLKFLRIDNQFYSGNLKSINFETMRDIRYSDHFPLRATYTLTD